MTESRVVTPHLRVVAKQRSTAHSRSSAKRSRLVCNDSGFRSTWRRPSQSGTMVQGWTTYTTPIYISTIQVVVRDTSLIRMNSHPVLEMQWALCSYLRLRWVSRFGRWVTKWLHPNHSNHSFTWAIFIPIIPVVKIPIIALGKHSCGPCWTPTPSFLLKIAQSCLWCSAKEGEHFKRSVRC